MNATKTIVAASAAVLLAAGLATATMAEERELHSDEARKKLAEFEYTGESQLCLSMSRIQDIDVLDDWTLLIEMPGHTYYVTHMPRQCPQLAFEDEFTYTITANQLCHDDTITVRVSRIRPFSGTTGATCALAKFEELREKKDGLDR